MLQGSHWHTASQAVGVESIRPEEGETINVNKTYIVSSAGRLESRVEAEDSATTFYFMGQYGICIRNH